MCENCEKYGNGTRWYFNPANYSRPLYDQIKEQKPSQLRTGRQVIPKGEWEAINAIRVATRLKDEDPDSFPEARDKASKLLTEVAPCQVVTPEEAKQIVDIASPVYQMACVCRFWHKNLEERGPEEYSCMGTGYCEHGRACR